MELVKYQQQQLARRERRAISQQEARSLAAVDSVARITDTSIRNGYLLAERTVLRAKGLNNLITTMMFDNPGLEMSLRQLEDLTMAAAAMKIREAMG